MSQFGQDFLKGLKDGALGLIPMLMGILLPQPGMTVRVGLVLAGVIVMVLGVITNTVQKDFGPLDTWGKVLKDTILGVCSSSIPLIQNGANSGTEWLVILSSIGISSLSIFANIIAQDVTANTILAKVAKDFAVLGIGAMVPVFTAALGTGQSILATLGIAGVALLSVLGNVVKTDVLGVPSTSQPASADKP